MSTRKRKEGHNRIRFKTWHPDKNDGLEGTFQWRLQNKPHSKDTLTTPAHNHVKSKEKKCNSQELATRSSAVPSPSLAAEVLPRVNTPFRNSLCLPIKPAGCVQSALSYYMNLHGRTSGLPSALNVYKDIHISLLLPFAMQHTVFFESTIAICRALILLSRGQSVHDDKALSYHRSRTISGLAARLNSNDPVDDASLLSAGNLLVLEYLVDNKEAVDAHSAGLVRMIQMRGDDLNQDTPWHKFMRMGLHGSNALAMLGSGREPLLPPDLESMLGDIVDELFSGKPAMYLEPSLEEPILSTTSNIPYTINALCIAGLVSTQTIRVLAIFAHTTICRVTTPSDWMSSFPNSQILLSILRRLILLSTSKIEEMLLHGLIAYTFQLRTLNTIGPFLDPQLRSLVDSIPTYQRPISIIEQNAMIWIGMCATGALNLRPTPMDGANVILDQLLELYPYTTRDWGRLEIMLRSFFWTEPIGAHWRICWEKGMQRREEREIITRRIRLREENGRAPDFNHGLDIRSKSYDLVEFEQIHGSDDVS